MREEHEARAAVTRQTRDEVCALRHLRVQLALDPALSEVGAQELGGGRLVSGRVHRVEPDQLAEELDRLVAERDRGHYRRVPRMRRNVRRSRTSSPSRRYS